VAGWIAVVETNTRLRSPVALRCFERDEAAGDVPVVDWKFRLVDDIARLAAMMGWSPIRPNHASRTSVQRDSPECDFVHFTTIWDGQAKATDS